jgi:hypothetical protein
MMPFGESDAGLANAYTHPGLLNMLQARRPNDYSIIIFSTKNQSMAAKKLTEIQEAEMHF